MHQLWMIISYHHTSLPLYWNQLSIIGRLHRSRAVSYHRNSIICSTACYVKSKKYIKAVHYWSFVKIIHRMMTSSNGNIFRVTGHLCGNSPVPGEFPAQRPVTRSVDVFFDLRLNYRWVNTREAGELGRYRAHYEVIVISNQWISLIKCH